MFLVLGRSSKHLKLLPVGLGNRSVGLACERENGFFVTRFQNEKDHDKVSLEGPWFSDRNLIIMKNLGPNMKIDKDLLTTMQVWIRLPCLVLDFGVQKLWELWLVLLVFWLKWMTYSEKK